MKKFLLSIVFVSLFLGAFAQVITPFSIRYQTTQKGGIRYVSNTAVTCSGIGCGAGRTEVPPAGTSTDNGFTAAYVDIDADGTTFMSSSDSLALPTCSEISWAGLYWGGENTTGGSNYATRNQVRLKRNNGAYVNLTADALQDNAVGFDTYHCYKDITAIVQAGGTNSRYTIANVAARVGGTNRFGGWSIVIVYKNDLQPMRNLTVFNGLSNVSGSNPITDITVSGFLTPLSGPVTFEVGNITHDGDRSSTGDQLMFNGGSGFVNISDAVNPLNDIFNSTYSYNGVQKTTPFINPGYTNSLGFDADIFIPNNAAKNYIGNSATSATLRLTTGGETFLTQVVSMAIDVYEPDLRAACRVVDLNGGSVLPGDILEYTIVGKNIGSDPSVNTFITDTLEYNAVYVPGSLQVTYGPNTGAKTDAAGDDQAEYIAAQRVIRVRIGTGANGVSGGQVNNSPLGIDSTQIKFRAMATTDCIILQCDNIINNRSYIFGTGNVSGNTFSNGSNPNIFDGFGCPVPGTTNTPISAASCTPPSAASNSPVCTGSTISLTTSPSSSIATYSWTGPGGFVSTAANPNRANATVAMAGTYTCVISVPLTACSYTVTTTVVVNVRPATPAPSSNTPVCTGNTINLSTAAVAGATYSWTGPSAFASALQNPTRPAATVAMAGTYSVTVTANGCTSAVGTTVVIVNTTPATPAPSSNTPVCTGNTINLSTTAVAGATYSWTGPNSFASSVQNPSITNSTVAMAGTYSVTVTTNGCTSGVGTTAVVVNTTPATPTASSNTPVCSGNTINLSTPAVAGATYSWTGPNSFASSVQNPSITNATVAMAGTYSVTVTTNGCTSAVGTTAVVVNATPATPTASSNTPVCTGNTINLSTPAVAGATYSWTGPSAFASAVQNPSRVNATVAMAGTYSVTVTTNGCTSAVGTTAVVVNTTPATPTASSNTPVCTGNTINLSTPAVAGATYSWTGPNSFASSVQNPSITNATVAMAGTYSVTVTTNGCTSGVGTTAVVVNSTPATPTASSNTPVCTGNTINLSTPAVAGATYSWTGPSAFASAVQNPSRVNATVAMAGTYSVTVTTNGCTSAVGTTAVVVNTTPATPTASSNTPVCTGNTINISTPAVAGATYSWTGPNSFASSVQNPSITNSTVAMAGTYSVTVTTNGCTSAVGTTAVVVNTTPATPTASSNTPVCSGNTINLSTPAVAGATYSWTGPNSFASSVQNPSITNATVAMAGTYSVTVTTNGCTSAVGTTAVVINATPATPTASSNTPVCTGNTINLSTPAVAGATYSWTGPSAFASAVQNPSRVNATVAMAGTYSVTVTTNGCTSGVGTTAVVVNATPATPTASSNTPVCTGNTINLSTPAVAGATYSWTGPNSFASSVQNPSITNATVAMAGTYSVTVTTNGCTSAVGTTAVVVNTTPATPAPSSNTPVCTGNTINLSTALVAGATYSWTGPNTFSSSVQNPSIPTATLAMTGTYSLTVTASGCTSAVGTTAVLVSAPPSAPTTSSNTPVCTGATINLTASSAGATMYTWTGPNAFSSSTQNPSIPSATTLMAGTYSVTATIGTCTSPVATTVVAINVTPASPVAGSNSPVCLTYPINLTASTVGSSTYGWTGPNSFTSTTQNPTIANATLLMSGTYSVTATENGCTSVPATVSVTTQDCAPSANVDIVSTNEDVTAVITVLANDTDPQSNINTGSVTITDLPGNGTASVGAGGIITYTPNPNFNGNDTLIYQICDNTVPTPFCDTAIVFITVTPVNDPPVVADTVITTPEDSVITVCLPILDADSGQTYSVSSCGNAVNGTATTTVTGNQVCVIYTPNPNYNGLDSLCVLICDNGTPSLCDTAMINIIITPVNDPPVVTDTIITTPEDSVITVCLPILDADSGQTYSVSSCGNAVNGTATTTVTGNQVCVIYTPNPNYNGLDSLCVLICDNGTPSLCDTAMINIIITPVNDPPVVTDTIITTPEDSVITVCLPILDADSGQTYSVSSCGNAVNGTATTTVTGNQVCVTYTPNPNYNGLDSLCVLICDNGTPSLCDTAMINIIITPVNDPPVVTDTIITTPEDSVITVCLPILDADSGQTYSVSSCGNAVNGTATTTVTGNQVCVIYTPNPNYNGLDSLCVLICDNGTPSLCDTAMINIIITPVNDPPVVTDTIITTPVDSVVSVCLPILDADSGQTYSVSSCGNAVNGTATTTVTGNQVCVTYTPGSGFSGLDSLCIIICDDGSPGLCDTSVVVINLQACSLSDPLADCDGDGVTNGTEITDGTNPSNPCNFLLASQTLTPLTAWTASDCDGDGVTNGTEVTNNTNPLDPCNYLTASITLTQGGNWNTVDCDGDGVLNGTEITDATNPNDPCNYLTASITLTQGGNWNTADCDGDGVINGTEITDATNPADPCNFLTASQTVTTSAAWNALDCDGDGVTNGTEISNSTNPADPCNYLTTSVTLTQGGNWNTVDCDGDGVLNGTEITDATNPNDPCNYLTASITLTQGGNWNTADCDGDGVINGTEITDATNPADPCNFLTASQTVTTSAAWNALDCDGDGVTNGTEISNSTNPADPCNYLTTSVTLTQGGNWNTVDCDGDGVLNGTEITDATNPNDPCNYLTASITLTQGGNWNTADCDGDGVINGTEITDATNPADPCNYLTASQTVTTSAAWNALDCDGDGVTNGTEISNSTNPADPCNYLTTSVTLTQGGNWNTVDCDGDGVLNGTEITDATNPSDPCNYLTASITLTQGGNWNTVDCDGDGVINGTEVADATNPADPCDYVTASITLSQGAGWNTMDCDGDGVINSTEVTDGTNPNDPCDFVQASQTVATSAAWNLLDCDNDGINNGEEIANGSNPSDACSPNPCVLNIPSGFSPNGDGVNDLYVIRGIEGYSNNTFVIFNRWGNKVFEAKPYTNTWDGKTTEGVRVGGDELPVGTYFYILDLGDGSEIIKGYIYLNR